MSRPEASTVDSMKLWMDGKSGCHPRPCSFSGLSAARLDSENRDDLVALHPPFENDWLITLLELPYIRLFFVHHHVDDSIALSSLKKMNRVLSILGMMITAIVLLGGIVTLYFVTSNHARIVLICVFTVLFSLSVQMLTNARRAELFASSAAYAAVLVVFVSGNLGSNGGSQP